MKSMCSAVTAAAALSFAVCWYAGACLAQESRSLDDQLAKIEDHWRPDSESAQYEYFARAGLIAEGLFAQDRIQADVAAVKLLDSLLSKQTESPAVGAADLLAKSKVTRFIVANPAATPVLRLQQLDSLQKLLRQIRSETVKDYVPKRVLMNVTPPSGTGPRVAGMSPDAVDDDKARAEYVAAIAQNQANNRTNARQAELLNMEAEFSKQILKQLERSARNGTIEADALTRFMGDARLTSAERHEMTEAMREGPRSAAR